MFSCKRIFHRGNTFGNYQNIYQMQSSFSQMATLPIEEKICHCPHLLTCQHRDGYTCYCPHICDRPPGAICFQCRKNPIEQSMIEQGINMCVSCFKTTRQCPYGASCNLVDKHRCPYYHGMQDVRPKCNIVNCLFLREADKPYCVTCYPIRKLLPICDFFMNHKCAYGGRCRKLHGRDDNRAYCIFCRTLYLGHHSAEDCAKETRNIHSKR